MTPRLRPLDVEPRIPAVPIGRAVDTDPRTSGGRREQTFRRRSFRPATSGTEAQARTPSARDRVTASSLRLLRRSPVSPSDRSTAARRAAPGCTGSGGSRCRGCEHHRIVPLVPGCWRGHGHRAAARRGRPMASRWSAPSGMSRDRGPVQPSGTATPRRLAWVRSASSRDPNALQEPSSSRRSDGRPRDRTDGRWSVLLPYRATTRPDGPSK